jgi:hypothetical protein
MTQRAALQNLDAAIHSAFARAGLAVVGTYLPPGGDPSVDTLVCRVYVDRGVQQLGNYAEVVGAKDVVTLLLEDVAAPVEKATVVFDGETVRLKTMESSDDSRQRWVVSHV